MIDAVKPAVSDKMVACPCTLIEQEEDCPVGYPSMLCGVCDGKGITTSEQVTALACEMIKIASDVGEPEDPFAAWETVDLFKTEYEKRSASALAAQGQVPVASIDDRSFSAFSALTAPAQPVENDIAAAVLSWMVKHDLLDAGNEYHASDVLAALDDLAPAQPVGVPVGYVSTGELHTLQQTDTCVDLFSTPPQDGFQFVPVYAAPQPPAEGGWNTDMSSAPRDGTKILLCLTGYEPVVGFFDGTRWEYQTRGDFVEEDHWLDWIEHTGYWKPDHWMPLPPAPANGGEQNG